MSDLLTPLNAMPLWAQTITLAFPTRYFVAILRALYLGLAILSIKSAHSPGEYPTATPTIWLAGANRASARNGTTFVPSRAICGRFCS